MEDETLKELWKAQNDKLDISVKLNQLLLESLQKQKAEVKLSHLARYKNRVAIFGIIWILFLGLLVYGNQFKNPFFSTSVLLIALFNVIAVYVYFKHAVLIKKIDYSDSIIKTQQKLIRLQTSTFTIGRILWLQLPFYTTFFWSWEMIGRMDIRFYLIALPITVVFSWVAIWLFKNLVPKNIDKKVVKWMVKDSIEYKSISKAMDFLNEIETFKKTG